jgi:hypothetical protein
MIQNISLPHILTKNFKNKINLFFSSYKNMGPTKMVMLVTVTLPLKNYKDKNPLKKKVLVPKNAHLSNVCGVEKVQQVKYKLIKSLDLSNLRGGGQTKNVNIIRRRLWKTILPLLSFSYNENDFVHHCRSSKLTT